MNWVIIKKCNALRVGSETAGRRETQMMQNEIHILWLETQSRIVNDYWQFGTWTIIKLDVTSELLLQNVGGATSKRTVKTWAHGNTILISWNSRNASCPIWKWNLDGKHQRECHTDCKVGSTYQQRHIFLSSRNMRWVSNAKYSLGSVQHACMIFRHSVML